MTSSNNLNGDQVWEYALHVIEFASDNEEHKEEYITHHPNALLQHDIRLEVDNNLPVVSCNTLNFIPRISLHDEFEGPDKYKRPDKELLLQITHGLHFMHSNGHFHGDINPTRIFRLFHGQYLITDILGETLSDFRKIPTEGRDPLENDINMLGQLFYYVLSCGQKIFKGRKKGTCQPEQLKCQDKSDRHIAADLICKMLKKESKVTTKDVLRNPLFWKKEKRLGFLRETVNRIKKTEHDTTIKGKLQEKWNTITEGNWITQLELKTNERRGNFNRKKLDPETLKKVVEKTLNICEYQANQPQVSSSGAKSVYYLLRFLRNNQAHFWDDPYPDTDRLDEIYGTHITGFWDFYSKRFPELLLHVYDKMRGNTEGDMTKLYYEDITYWSPEENEDSIN